MQQSNTNIYDASRSQRSFGGNVVGAWRSYSLNATVDRSENFYNTTDSVVNGGSPRVMFSRNERPLFGGRVLLGQQRVRAFPPAVEQLATVGDTPHRDDRSGWRARFLATDPLSVQAMAVVHRQHVGQLARDVLHAQLRLDPVDPASRLARIVDDALNRQYFTLSAQAVGPVFNRIWDTPDNGYAERFKHSIEPFFNVPRTSAIDNFDQIVQTDGIDGVLGNTTSFTYGLNNRFYAKRRDRADQPGAGNHQRLLSQTYYTDPLGAATIASTQRSIGSARRATSRRLSQCPRHADARHRGADERRIRQPAP